MRLARVPLVRDVARDITETAAHAKQAIALFGRDATVMGRLGPITVVAGQ
jgi:hypothetical protein